jgi:hypothetical protein
MPMLLKKEKKNQHSTEKDERKEKTTQNIQIKKETNMVNSSYEPKYHSICNKCKWTK